MSVSNKSYCVDVLNVTRKAKRSQKQCRLVNIGVTYPVRTRIAETELSDLLKLGRYDLFEMALYVCVFVCPVRGGNIERLKSERGKEENGERQ